MTELEVRIVELKPIRVHSELGYGESPEGIALEKAQAWAYDQGIRLEEHRMFGFNNPNPSPGSPNYGYEIWIEASGGLQPGEMETLKSFQGGRFAVTRVKGVENIFNTWQQLVAWSEKSPYQMRHDQCLEEHLEYLNKPLDEYVLDLYLPIA